MMAMVCIMNVPRGYPNESCWLGVDMMLYSFKI